MIKISVVIISKNSAKYLKKCLKSVNWADEIVLVDNDSTDQTIEIAKDFGVKVFEHDWLGWAKQKNLAISLTKNNWVLSLDTDEVLDEELIQSIESVDGGTFDGYELNRKNLYAGKWVKHCGWYPDWQLRLFKKGKMQYEDKEVHEHVEPVGKIGELKGNIIHYTYASNREYFAKLERYTMLDAQYLFKQKKMWTLIYQILKPIKEFLEKYFKQCGFLDGLLGFKISIFSAYYRWQVAKKLKELYAHRH